MKSAYTTIYINPIERISAQGRHLHMFYSYNKNNELMPTAKMNSTMAGGAEKVYKFAEHISDKTKISTGLDKLIDNPFKGLTSEEILSSYSLNEKWQPLLDKIVNQSQITKQTYFEIKHGKSPGYYSDDKFYNGDVKKPTYLKELTVILYDRPNRFCNDTPEGEIKMEMMRNHSKVAQNKNSINPSFHHFYISQEDEAEIEQSNKREIIEKATAHLYLLKTEKPKLRSYQMAVLLKDFKGDTLLKGEVTDSRVNNILSDFVGLSDKSQVENCNKFLQKVEQLSSREGLEKFETEYLIQQAINTNVITSRDGYLYWNSKGSIPNVSKWSDYERLVNFFVKEKVTQNSKDAEKTNWFTELYNEVKEKGIRLE